MNFEVEVLRPTKYLWGDELPNGSWTGLHGYVQRDYADIAAGLIAPSYHRLHFEDYSQPITTDNCVWIVPETRPDNWNKLWRAFLSLIPLILLIIAVFFVFGYLLCESVIL